MWPPLGKSGDRASVSRVTGWTRSSQPALSLSLPLLYRGGNSPGLMPAKFAFENGLLPLGNKLWYCRVTCKKIWNVPPHCKYNSPGALWMNMTAHPPLWRLSEDRLSPLRRPSEDGASFCRRLPPGITRRNKSSTTERRHKCSHYRLPVKCTCRSNKVGAQIPHSTGHPESE